MMKLKKRLLSLALAAVMVVSLAACGSSPEPVEEPDEIEIDTSNLVFLNPLEIPDGSQLNTIPNLIPKMKEKYEQNSDTIGWLQVPNTNIDDVVVQSPTDTTNSNAFYLRRDFNKRQDFNGTYYISYASNIDGTREGLSPNTVLFGHSMTDNIETGTLLDQLKRYRADEQFAVENPYIFFSLLEENLVWEVFAVFDCKIDYNYITANPDPDQFMELVNESMKRSYYNYDVQITADDKILTISTCTYNYTTVYPNDYRFVVMARLVPADETLKETASLTVNNDRKTP